jgi:hypothetical protein
MTKLKDLAARLKIVPFPMLARFDFFQQPVKPRPDTERA